MKNNIRLPGWGSSQVAILIYYAQSQGLAIEEILCGSDITEAMLELQDPSLNQELIVIQNIMGLLPIHPFELGLSIGCMCNASSFGLFGHVLMACATADQVFNVVAKFLTGDHDFIKVDPRIEDNKIVTSFEITGDLPANFHLETEQFILGRSMGSSIALQKHVLAGLPCLTTEVGFRGEELPGMMQVGELYDCGVKFQQRYNYLHSDISLLNLVFPLGNHMLSNILLKRAGNYLYSKRGGVSGKPDIHERIALLLEQAAYTNVSKEKIASKLNMSSRTLSRYLLREGTSWRDLYVKLRMDKAKKLLTTSSENLDVIAFKVGFSSSSAFSSAFSRTTGKSPHEYRMKIV